VGEVGDEGVARCHLDRSGGVSPWQWPKNNGHGEIPFGSAQGRLFVASLLRMTAGGGREGQARLKLGEEAVGLVERRLIRVRRAV